MDWLLDGAPLPANVQLGLANERYWFKSGRREKLGNVFPISFSVVLAVAEAPWVRSLHRPSHHRVLVTLFPPSAHSGRREETASVAVMLWGAPVG